MTAEGIMGLCVFVCLFFKFVTMQEGRRETGRFLGTTIISFKFRLRHQRSVHQHLYNERNVRWYSPKLWGGVPVIGGNGDMYPLVFGFQLSKDKSMQAALVHQFT